MNHITMNLNHDSTILKYNMSMDTQVTYNERDVREFIYDYSDFVNTEWVDLEGIVKHISKTIPEKISMNDFYNYVADYCVSKTSIHPDYNKLASRICVDRLHMSTPAKFIDAIEILYNNGGNGTSLVSEALLKIVKKHHNELEKYIDTERDYLFDYFGIKTLERSYLLKVHTKNKKKIIIERPQYMIMRVALGIHGENLKDAIETYNLISQKYFTHATPTLFNAGTNRPQLSSCFLFSIEDSLESIMEITKQIALISKWAGGIGVSLSSIRARGSLIKGTNGISDGIIPLCGVLNKLSKYVNQGGKRPGSIACYLETWHADIYEFMELRKANSGNDDNRSRDLFLASWIPDLFMERVKVGGVWSLMCPNECPGLDKSHGKEFEKLYLDYEQNKKYKRQVKARDLMKHLLECQIETGFTYMCYKDQCNNKSNQQNLGTIRCSNLCSEIVEYSDGNTTAVCNLASLCLPRFIVETDGKKQFNYDFLMKVVRVAVRNLNKVIDINFYPTEQTARSNNQTRPIGLGVQGLADVYNIFGYAYESHEASFLNKKIFESIYFAALDESKELAKKYGSYDTFKGSPFSEGKLQFHLWGMTVEDLITSKEYNWYKLVEEIKKYGTRNSLLTALMPTAGTSQLMKCYESFEPYISNIFVKTTMAGEFIVINEQLVKDLIKLDLWSEDMRKLIIINNGSVQTINSIPSDIKEIYKTAFEIKLKSMINQSADRAPFIDQTQSMNLFMKNPNPKSLLSTHFHAWEKGLKTGMYYLRGSSSINPIQFGIDITDIMRLTGRTNTIDLISDEFNLNLTDTPIAHSEAPVKLNMEQYTKNKIERDGCEETESTEVGCLMCSG